jgi:hypothetical protein
LRRFSSSKKLIESLFGHKLIVGAGIAARRASHMFKNPKGMFQ